MHCARKMRGQEYCSGPYAESANGLATTNKPKNHPSNQVLEYLSHRKARHTKKTKSHAQIYLQLSNLQYDEIPLKRCEKRAKKQPFSQRFNEIIILQVGGKSAHNSSSFSYTSLFDTINVQIWPGPSADGLGPRLAPNTTILQFASAKFDGGRITRICKAHRRHGPSGRM